MDMEMIIKQIWPTIAFLFLSTLLLGLLYPGFITLILQTAFHDKANGSLLFHGEKVIGSALIGQEFSAPKYFWSRPSATTPFPYNAASSTGSNLGAANPQLLKNIQDRITLFQKFGSASKGIPVDLVMASGSGLDPHISIQGAIYQISRVAKARNMDEKTLYVLINRMIEKRQLLLLGEPRINVLELNIALDKLPSI